MKGLPLLLLRQRPSALLLSNLKRKAMQLTASTSRSLTDRNRRHPICKQKSKQNSSQPTCCVSDFNNKLFVAVASGHNYQESSDRLRDTIRLAAQSKNITRNNKTAISQQVADKPNLDKPELRCIDKYCSRPVFKVNERLCKHHFGNVVKKSMRKHFKNLYPGPEMAYSALDFTGRGFIFGKDILNNPIMSKL